ncbi:hypothetical protein GYMLUDRAFT_46288 [Collybiopsis luxurians FD-317 M1]|uniref:Uncharacterized protein n=1 Tax=Collybiopsis luxurians FD-317 M1 TaxID=944289 RepID=A0A0D0C4S8_9AGAR|nr:hypothetical protein GYMLUDRAFT_46288 [Collybiopsis luxurians FD-317 M1]
MSTTSESNKVERAVILYSSIHPAPPPPSAIPPNTPTPAPKNMTSQRWIWFFLAGLIITVPFAIRAYRNPTGIPIMCILYIFQLILVIGTIFTSAAEHQEDVLFMILFEATLGFFVSSTSPNPYPLSVDEAMTATFVVAVQFLHSIILATPVSILAFLCTSQVRFQEDIGNETRFKYYISDRIFSSQVHRYIQLISTGVDHVFRLPRQVKEAFVALLFPHSTSDHSYKPINP